MPTVKDKITGEVVEELSYDTEGEAMAEEIVKENPNLEVDYSPGGESNAMDRTETYRFGGLVPDQPRFGQGTMIGGNQPLGTPMESDLLPTQPLYKKGGKVDKYGKK